MSVMLTCSSEAKKKVGNSIFITGTARSGTTILGKLIHSFNNVEYLFEPPTLFSLFSKYESLSDGDLNTWKLLFETYLYEDFFLNAISGRNINCNIQDDSSIYRVKDIEDIKSRLEGKNRKLNTELLSKNGVIAYKIPEMTFMIEHLQHMYPKSRQVVIDRGPVESIHSLIAKGWFSDQGLKKNFYNPHFIIDGVKLPFWLGAEDANSWLKYNEVERCAYYIIKIMAYDFDSRVIKLRYSEMLDSPRDFTVCLANKLNLSFGSRTEEIIQSIKPMSTTVRSHNILNDIRDSKLLDELSILCKQ